MLSACVAAATFLFWPSVSHRLRLTAADEWLFWTDTLGLAVFAANGAHTGALIQARAQRTRDASPCSTPGTPQDDATLRRRLGSTLRDVPSVA